jgi:hypothetical protein
MQLIRLGETSDVAFTRGTEHGLAAYLLFLGTVHLCEHFIFPWSFIEHSVLLGCDGVSAGECFWSLRRGSIEARLRNTRPTKERHIPVDLNLHGWILPQASISVTATITMNCECLTVS